MSEETPSWIQGTGVETSMEGDPRSGGANIRYWMPPGSEKTVIFLSEGNDAPVIWEHQYKQGNSYKNWSTCLQPLGMTCPLCAAADASKTSGRYKGMFFSIIDCTEFTDKGGNKRVNEKRILVAKASTADIIKRKYISRVDAGGGLRGAKFKIYRPKKDTSAAVGEDYEFIEMVDLAKFEDTTPFDLMEIAKPDPEKMERAAALLMGDGGSDEKPAGSDSKVSY